jgi:secreted PhoX family phosphatase
VEGLKVTAKLHKLVQDRISRRTFLRDLGLLTAGAAASTTSLPLAAASAPKQAAGQLPITPIPASFDDAVVLPEGFSYQVVIKRGDVFTRDGKTFGDNCDWTGWFPFEGSNGSEGLLVVNNEYINPYLLYGYESMEEGGETPKTPEQILMEKQHVGISVVHLRRENGVWTVIADSDYATRWDATGPMIPFTGPVAGAATVGGAAEVVGTLANCAGGYTPWGTAISCEEDYMYGYGEDSVTEVEMEDTFRWLDDAATAQRPEHYGWVVEVDPMRGTARKHTALGRFLHEAIAIGLGSTGKAVMYMTDDDDERCLYKFISRDNYNPNNREANFSLLENGTLYVANFSSGEWIPVVWEGNEELLGDPENVDGYTLTSQIDVLTYTHQAAIALGGTPGDSPEGISIHPLTKHIFVAYSGNDDRINVHGHITEIMETNDDHEALTFDWDVFAVGGRRAGFSGPDNITFDQLGNLWLVTDGESGQAEGIYSFLGNNAMFVLPTEGENFGKAFRVLSGPVGAELTGPSWADDRTLFLSVQHPGEGTEPGDPWRSSWPDGGSAEPRAAVIAISGPFPAAQA